MSIVRDLIDGGVTIGALTFVDGTSEQAIAAALARALTILRASENVEPADPTGEDAAGPPFLMHAMGNGQESWYPAGIANATALGTGAPSANVARIFPVFCGRETRFNGCGIWVTTPAAGNARVFAYRCSPDAARTGDLRPTTLIAQSGNLDTGTNGLKSATPDILVPARQLLWVGVVTSAAPTVRTMSVGGMWPIAGLDAAGNVAPRVGLSFAHPFGPLPAVFPTSGVSFVTSGPFPAVAVRATST